MPVACPVCDEYFDDYQPLAVHFYRLAEANDDGHIMWMNRHATKFRMEPEALAKRLKQVFESDGGDINPEEKVPR